MASLEREDWDFSGVPDSELIACCYWEYARESPFIRGVRERSLKRWMPLYAKGTWISSPRDEELYRDLDKLQSIGYPAEVFLCGISCPPDNVLPDAPPPKPHESYPVTGSFPTPWQQLTKEERAYRSHIGTDVERIPLVPFERGYSFDAEDILQSVRAQRREVEAANDEVRRENPKKTEEALCRQGKLRFPTIPPSIYWVGGEEVTVVRIRWGSFTDDEIANYFRKWVKVNRPAKYPAPNAQGRKLHDWRVALGRLGIMRALHARSFADHRFPKLFKERGEKHCYTARKLALRKFCDLFPFLPGGEKPLSWATKGGRSTK